MLHRAFEQLALSSVCSFSFRSLLTSLLFLVLGVLVRECCLMVKGMEPASLPRGSNSAESEEWEEVEKSLEELVKNRRLKVERLERELDAYRKHYAKLVESFSIPTFPTLPEGTCSAAFRQSNALQ